MEARILPVRCAVLNLIFRKYHLKTIRILQQFKKTNLKMRHFLSHMPKKKTYKIVHHQKIHWNRPKVMNSQEKDHQIVLEDKHWLNSISSRFRNQTQRGRTDSLMMRSTPLKRGYLAPLERAKSKDNHKMKKMMKTSEKQLLRKVP